MVNLQWTAVFLLAGCIRNTRGAASAAVDLTKQCTWNPAGPLGEDTAGLACPRVIDDESAARTSSWGPWTHQPLCAHPKDGKSSKYCVFTYAPFRGQSGISIMTTPEVATNAINLLEDPNPQWQHKLAPPYFLPPDPWPYEIKDVAGKGKGAVANRTIRKGEVILRELPVLVTLMEEPKSISERAVREMLELGFEQLPERDQKRVLDMARSGGGHALEDVMKTNVFGIYLHDIDHSGLYPEIGRLNHGCRPNAFTRFSRRTLMLEVVAYKNIRPGEELAISYVPLNLLHGDRRYLLRGWSFNCTCSLCSSRPKIAVSDRNRRRVQAILDELKVKENRSPEMVEVLTGELMDLLESEGLSAQVGDFAEILAQVHLQMGDLTKAREHAQMALDKQTHFKGVDSEPTERVRRYLKFLDELEYM